MNGAHLLADVGGTYARFATRGGPRNGPEAYAGVSRYRVADHPSLADAAERYLDTFAAQDRPQSAVIAVASAVNGDIVQFSNSAWRFSIRELRERLRLQQVRVINDFAAIAWSLPALEPADLARIGGGRDPQFGSEQVHLVVGPGTGLGLSAVKRTAHGPVILDSEGGHLGFAPRGDLERDLHQRLSQIFGRVSYERVLSGSGLVNVYGALADIHDRKVTLDAPDQITHAARQGDALALQTVQCFCSVLGSFAGDAVLAFGGWDGLYLAGEMLNYVLDPATEALFRESFEDKGRFSETLRQVPTMRILRSDVGLLGASNLSRTVEAW